MRKTLICFDIDGTLINGYHGSIESSTLNVLKQLREKGYMLALATGRSLGGLKEIEIQNLFDWDGIVCSNGQVVLDKNQTVLFKQTLRPDLVYSFLSEAKKRNIAVLGQGDEWRLYTELNDAVMSVHQKYNMALPIRERYHGQTIYSLMVYGEDYSLVEAFDELTVTLGPFGYGDVNLKGVSKAQGIQVLLEALGCKELIAFGDGLNDIEMFKLADKSVAMSYASESLKKHSSVIVDRQDNQIERGVELLHLLEGK